MRREVAPAAPPDARLAAKNFQNWVLGSMPSMKICNEKETIRLHQMKTQCLMAALVLDEKWCVLGCEDKYMRRQDGAS